MYTNDEQEKRMMERVIKRYKYVTTKMNEISNYIAKYEESDNSIILDFILDNMKGMPMSDLKIGRIVLSMCQTNCYFVYREGEKKVILFGLSPTAK